MERKKNLVYLSAFVFSILLFLFMSFLAHENTLENINETVNGSYSSVSNLNQMESLFYSQTLMIPQHISGVDAISLTSFQSYTQTFLKLYQVEYEKADTIEEINYIFDVHSQYNNYIDMFTQLQNYNVYDSKGREDAYLYYKLTMTPQITAVFSSINTYKEYMEKTASEEREEMMKKNRNNVIALIAIFLILSITMFITSNALINRHIKPMQNLLEEQKKFDKTKSDFISTISHEFKTPLTSIIMGADLLLNPSVGEINDDQRELISTIKEDSFSLTNLVNNLLQMSKYDSSEVTYSFGNADISSIIEQSMSQFRHMAQKMNIDFIYEAQDPLPMINADSEKIMWVMNNLLSNAFKYSDSGDQIKIRAYQNIDDHIIVQVSDQGPGIPPKYFESIFERYFQVNESDIELGGTGMGLALSKEIITAHGGDIWCTNNTPRGSVFSFTVPVLNTMPLDIKR